MSPADHRGDAGVIDHDQRLAEMLLDVLQGRGYGFVAWKRPGPGPTPRRHWPEGFGDPFSAPGALVAVPMTTAPGAPVPAQSPGYLGWRRLPSDLPRRDSWDSSLSLSQARPRVAAERLDAIQGMGMMPSRSGCEACQDLARPALDQLGDALFRQQLDALHPANRAVQQLCQQVGRSVSRSSRHGGAPTFCTSAIFGACHCRLSTEAAN